MKIYESQIRKLRMKLGLSTTQLAHRLGISQSSALRLEQSEARGAITLATLERVARAMRVRFDYQFIPQERLSRTGKIEKFGMRRLSGSSKRRESVNDLSRIEDVQRNLKASPQDRVRQACELSDLGRKIALCSNKRF